MLGAKLSTPVFNLVMLWVMTALLYALLWWDGLRKLMELFPSGRRKKKS